MPPIQTFSIYRFRVRDARAGQWRISRDKLTIEEAAERHGPGNYVPLAWTKEARHFNPLRMGAAHLQVRIAVRSGDEKA